MIYNYRCTTFIQLVIVIILIDHTNAQIVNWFAVPTIRAGKYKYMQDKSIRLLHSLLPLTPHPP